MKVIHTDDAPQAVGPYSQAIVSNGFVFIAGQIALSNETGEILGNDIVSQTEQVIRNISAILRSVGVGLEKVVRCDVYLKNLSDFEAFNKIYDKYFGSSRPTRITVEVAALPKNALIEISAIAELD